MTAVKKAAGILLAAGMLCSAIGCGNHAVPSDSGISSAASASLAASSSSLVTPVSSAVSAASESSQSSSSDKKVNESSDLNSSKQNSSVSKVQSSKVPPVSVSSTVTSHFSVRTVFRKTTQSSMKIDVTIPQFSGFSAAEALNDKIQQIVDDGIAEVKDAAKYTHTAGTSLYFGSNYDYSIHGNILSVWLNNDEYTGGAHPNSYIRSVTVNMKTGEFYNKLGSLFQDEAAGKKEVTGMMIQNLTKQSELDSDMLSSAVSRIKARNGDFQFYIDNSSLVTYFDTYDLLPYAYGIPKFSLDLSKMHAKIKD